MTVKGCLLPKSLALHVLLPNWAILILTFWAKILPKQVLILLFLFTLCCLLKLAAKAHLFQYFPLFLSILLLRLQFLFIKF